MPKFDLVAAPRYLDIQCPTGCYHYKRINLTTVSGASESEKAYVEYTGYCLDCETRLVLRLYERSIDPTDQQIVFQTDQRVKQLILDLENMGFVHEADNVLRKAVACRLIYEKEMRK